MTVSIITAEAQAAGPGNGESLDAGAGGMYNFMKPSRLQAG